MPAPHPNADPAYHHEPFKGEVPVGHHDRSIHYDPNASAENPVVISHTFENAAPSHQAVPGHYNPSPSTTSTSSSHNTGVPSTTHTHSHDYDRSTHSHPHPTGGQDETFTRDRLEHDTIPGAGTNANPASHGRHFNDANPGSEHVTPGSVVDGTSQSAAQKSRNTDHEHGENPASRAENSGAPGGFDYPEQKHAGKTGLGPHYGEQHHVGIVDKIKAKLSHDDPAHAQGRPANEAENHAGQETAFTRADDGANIGSHEGALPAKGTTASDVRESGHAASGSAGTAPGI